MKLAAQANVFGWLLLLGVVTVLVGIGAGLSGLVVSVGVHAISSAAYDYSHGTFLNGLLTTDPWRRVAALAVAGLIGGIGWWALRRFARPVVSVAATVGTTGPAARMPAVATIFNAALQTIIVGLGASIGREVAPRELAALVAGWLTDKAGVSARERRILVACGAGAGLAAVYDVPLGGAIFAIEVLLAEISLATVFTALTTAGIAALVARLVVPAETVFALPQFQLTPALYLWAVLVGPILGLAAVGYLRLVLLAERLRPRDWNVLWIMPVVFTAVGFASLALPAILGNGQPLAEVAFSATASIGLLAVLAATKALATAATMASGAAGGNLTPSLALGAATGGVLGGLWSMWWPGTPVAAFAFVAAAAFLAATMRAPVTALVLVVEFTGQGPALLVPAMIAVVGAFAVSLIERRRESSRTESLARPPE